MSTTEAALFPRARIPYGTWGSSYFPAWQTSALAEVNIGHFAGESMARILGMRGVPKSVFNDTIELLGAADEAEFLDKVLAAASTGEADAPTVETADCRE